VGASVIVLPYRNPLVTANLAATVDQVSGGRFVFGVGVGWGEEEFRKAGRSRGPALTPGNALVLGSTRKGAGRATFDRAPDEVAAEQFVSDVKPALA
jgi:Luciferase-like monooxygenase